MLTLKIDDQLNLLYYNPFSQDSCTIRVDTTDSRVFVENATGAFAVTIQDYTRKLLVLKEEEDAIKIPYVHVISQVTVQVKHFHRTNVSWKDVVLKFRIKNFLNFFLLITSFVMCPFKLLNFSIILGHNVILS